MNEALEFMLQRYQCISRRDYENAIKEIIQEIALLGLWRSKFFEKAAFYGGTALRILYGLDRFSEDLDFSLLAPCKDFVLKEYLKAVQDELASFGFHTNVDEKIKDNGSSIQSAFIKAGTKKQLLQIKVPFDIHQKIHKDETLKIKLEIDVNPPADFQTEAKFLLLPIPFTVNSYQLPDLFAGKMHALLCRPWKNRVKGRDWYDFYWYISRNVPVRIRHLQLRLFQTNHWPEAKSLTKEVLLNLLSKRIAQIDFEQAKADVLPFLKDPASVVLWSQPFFEEISQRITIID